jgi:hypothetical protein
MSGYDIGIWVTEEEYNDTGWNVRDTVDSLLDAADEFYDNNYIETYVKDNKIAAPTQNPSCSNSFTTSAACYYGEVTYPSLYTWWDSKIDNESGCYLDSEPDANLLLTDWGVAGCGGGNSATAGAGSIGQINGSDDYDSGKGSAAAGVALQEAGHCIINAPDDDGDGEGDHDVADQKYHNGYWYTTPMGVSYYDEFDSTNECGELITDPSDWDYVDFRFSSCSENHLK